MRTHGGVLAVMLLALVCAATPARAGVAPELVLGFGNSFAANGDPGEGGVSVTGSILWPFEERFMFGVSFYADDLGTGLAQLVDPNTGQDLGTVADLHRWSYGGEWRTEATLHRNRRTRWVWNAGFGYAREERDQRGLVNGVVSGLMASTGTSFLLQAAHGHAFGATVALRHAFVSREFDAGRPTSWATAAFEWRWQGTPKE